MFMHIALVVIVVAALALLLVVVPVIALQLLLRLIAPPLARSAAEEMREVPARPLDLSRATS